MGGIFVPVGGTSRGHSRLSRQRLWPLVVSTVGRAGLMARVLFYSGILLEVQPPYGRQSRKHPRMLG